MMNFCVTTFSFFRRDEIEHGADNEKKNVVHPDDLRRTRKVYKTYLFDIMDG